LRLLGIDLGGTNIKLAVIEDDRIVKTEQIPTLSEEGPDAVLQRVTALGLAHAPADAVGVAMPGLVDEEGRAIILASLHGDWAGRPIAEPLTEAFGMPVTLINDGHAFALAESMLGSGRGYENVMCVTCGTGIGGGLVLGGRLHLGPRERAGELGHTSVVEDGLACSCGNSGCLELYAGSRAIAAAAGRNSFDETVFAAVEGDAAATAAIARAGTLIGRAIASVVIFLCPDRVVIGGGVATAGPLLLDPIRAELARRAPVAPLELIELVPAELGTIAGAAGAALFAARSL
jgi:glucokinase